MRLPSLQTEIERPLRAIVAIPAKNEAKHLPACLDALSNQIDAHGRGVAPGTFGVIVFANDCSDDTGKIAREIARVVPYELRVVEARLPKTRAHAGGARRGAMDLAEAWLAEVGATDGVILTTDADSCAASSWIDANLRGFEQGAQSVLGRISLDKEGEKLPAQLHVRGKLEAVYEDLLTEMAARLDPQDCNPWPHHSTISGATLALTRELYLRVGRLPLAPLGEDKALVAAMRRHDAAIRFSSEAAVVTSGRVMGRAPGGVADTLRLRSDDPSALCDASLEPCSTAYRRALWRGRLRRSSSWQGLRWRTALRVTPRIAAIAQRSRTFGAAWEKIEQASPILTRRPLAPAELPRQIELATRVLRRLAEKLAPYEDIEPILRAPDAPDALDVLL